MGEISTRKTKKISLIKTKLQPLSQLRGENIKAYKNMESFFAINSA